ncbi:MAG: hypothetical protein ABGX04_05470, partial [Myxococcales bacterium]
MHRVIATALCLTWMNLSAASLCSAGELDDFEGGLDRKSGGSSEGTARKSGSSDTEWSDSDAEGAFFGELLGYLVGYPLAAMIHGVIQTNKYLEEREPYTPVIPYARLSGHYHPLVESDVQAGEIRAELGIGPIAIAGEFIRYVEDKPKDWLNSWTAEALLRIGPSKGFRFDVALGARGIEGDSSHTGFQAGLSLGFYPREFVGAEMDLRWADIGEQGLSDYRAALLLRHPKLPGVAVRTGYRFVKGGGETLHGPEVG